MMPMRSGLISLAAFALASLGSLAADAGPRAVVELFTSQGCSSCPPADHVLGELARDPSLIAMSLPIDYWDYLGWKDTLAKPRHTARQRGYAHARGDREVYTPQVVVNGAVHVLGSDKGAIERAIAQTRRNAATLSLPVKLAVADDKLTVNVQTANAAASNGEVWLCALSKDVPVAIGRGENHGHTITYHSVVRRWMKLGDWTGGAHTFNVPRNEIGTADTVAVIVQGGSSDELGTMLGAAVASLH